MARYLLGAYWGARKESIQECADRLCGFFSELIACDSALATWYERGRSRKASAKPADVTDQKYLLRLLDRGRNRRDVGHTVIEELGFRIGLWNGSGEPRRVAGLSITCGLHCTDVNFSGSMSNYVVLDLPEDLGELEQAERMTHVAAVVARVWAPDWAGVMSKDAMNERGFSAKIPFVDWIVFVPREIDSVPQPSSLVKLAGLGTIILTQPVPPSGDNPRDRVTIHRVEEILRQPIPTKQ